MTSLVGRGQEIKEVNRCIGRARLVTLLGPGGVGKTRLALEIASGAEAQAGGYPGEGRATYWADLAPVGDEELVALALAEAVGARETGDPLEALCRQLGDGEALLVLDNCEHLVPALAHACQAALRACPGLRVLATSREPLGVPGEVTWPVSPLKVPAEVQPAHGDLAPLATCESVQLFVERAQAALPAFFLSEDNAAAVAQVARQLDGLPLAIELAVGNLRVLSVEELARSLGSSLKVLVGGPRTLPSRHQALSAALEWSHRLLDREEQELLRRLSVFAGEFSVAAASEVAAGGLPGGAYDLLRRLVDKSWVVAGSDGGQAWCRLLVTVRQFARERLAAAAEEDEYCTAHLRWCVRRAQEAEQKLEGTAQATELARLDREINDLRAGLHFARGSGDAVSVLRIASALARFWYLHGYYREGREWLDWAVVSGPGAPAPVRAKALQASGRLAFLQCDYAGAVRRLSAALRLYGDLGDNRGRSTTLQVLGSVDREQGRYQQAELHHSESKTLFEALGDRWGVASAWGYLGFSAWLQGDFAHAGEQCRTALEQFQQLGDAEGTAWSLLSLGVVSLYEGDLERAEQLLARSRQISEEIGFKEGQAWCLNQQGALAVRRHDPGARELLLASAELHRELGDQWRLASVLEALARAVLESDPRRTAMLLGAAGAARERIGTPLPPCERPEHTEALETARAALGDAAWERAWTEGASVAIDDLMCPWAEPLPAQVPARRAAGAPTPRSATAGQEEQRGGVLALRIRALGGAEVMAGGRVLGPREWGYAKPQELFFLLCSSPPRTKEQLGAELWPDLGERQLRNALHSALRDMRKALGDRDWVVFSSGRYSFNRSRPHRYDVSDFESALAAARRLPGPEALPHLQRALSAYSGDFLPYLGAWEWADNRRRELRSSYEMALGATGAAMVQAGRHLQALQVYERAVAHEPLNEAFHRELMKCLSRLGQPARALRHYEELVDLLHREVGAKPARETAQLYDQLRAGT
ncbi:MAG: BTAD domain-containing putative transcriptional regulator [Acidimicrobiales bacterium]